MSTTNRASSVMTRSDIQTVGGIVDEYALQPRRTYLKRKAPASSYVHDLRRQMAYGKRNPSEQRLEIAFSDLEDGVPVSLVRASFEAEIALIEEVAATLDEKRGIARADAPLLPLLQRENRLQAEQDAAERDLIANPDSIEAHDRVLLAHARYRAESDRMVSTIRARRAALQMRKDRGATRVLHTTKPAGRDVPDGPLSTTAPAMYVGAGSRGSAR